MSAIEKVNKSGLSADEKKALKALMGHKTSIRDQIAEDSAVDDALLRAYLNGRGLPKQTAFATHKSTEYDGIQDLSTALPRSKLVADLFHKVVEGSSRFVHLGSPAATGKTSLLQLFELYCEERGVICIYVSMLMEDFRSVLREKTGINASTWKLEPDKNGECVCADPSKSFVVMLDDAQRRYDDVDLWTSLIKSDVALSLPGNIRFIISATYSLGTDVSPVDFKLSMPWLGPESFRLSREEAVEFVRLSSVRAEAEPAGRLLVDPALRNVIATHCNCHIGALSVSVKEIVKEFFHNTSVTVEEIVSFYLSKGMASRFLRCYSSGVTFLPERVRACLVQSLTVGLASVPVDEDLTAFRQLIRSGVLYEAQDGRVTFASPAAARYVNDLIFPGRSGESVEMIKASGVFVLMKEVVKRMSGTTLRQSVVRSSADMPSEATFQHLMLAALEAETPPSCYICPELSKYFPPPAASHAMEANEGAAEKGLPEIKGRCDYFLNGVLCWAIEALICGRGVEEHVARLEGNGKYVGLAFADHLVVDFRVNATGKPTNVKRYERRMSVFFKQGDFTFCNVLCGLNGPAEEVRLAH